jgi:hypothetical protein
VGWGGGEQKAASSAQARAQTQLANELSAAPINNHPAVGQLEKRYICIINILKTHHYHYRCCSLKTRLVTTSVSAFPFF